MIPISTKDRLLKIILKAAKNPHHAAYPMASIISDSIIVFKTHNFYTFQITLDFLTPSPSIADFVDLGQLCPNDHEFNEFLKYNPIPQPFPLPCLLHPGFGLSLWLHLPNEHLKNLLNNKSFSFSHVPYPASGQMTLGKTSVGIHPTNTVPYYCRIIGKSK
jgi:hypothetical protein